MEMEKSKCTVTFGDESKALVKGKVDGERERGKGKKFSYVDALEKGRGIFDNKTRPNSYGKLVNNKPSRKPVIFCTLLTSAGNEAYVAIYGVSASVQDGMDAMIENDLWLIYNVPFILKKWTPDANIKKGDGQSSHPRAIFELRADVELKDTLVVVLKFVEENPKIKSLQELYKVTDEIPLLCLYANSELLVFEEAMEKTIRIIISIAAQNGWKIHQMDVKLAFLNGLIKEEVYLEQTKGYVAKWQEVAVLILFRDFNVVRSRNERFGSLFIDRDATSFNEFIAKGDLHDFPLDDGANISLLQYADDALFFGLKINLSKSRLFGIGVPEEEVVNITRVVNCSYGSLPFSYLGLLVGKDMNRIEAWADIVNTFTKKLSSWKANLLSIGGRLTLVKSVLGSLPIYFLSMFKAPEAVISKLESIRRRFF
nr:reverse transcriptase domain, reverse transcriptase zinc-binding domain protein [Tanacetum cinerariifolium]